MPKSLVKNRMVEDWIFRLATASPKLSDLTEKQLRGIAQATLVDELKRSLRKRVEVQRIDYKAEKKAFLKRYTSRHTQKAYRIGLRKLEKFCNSKHISVTELSPKTADDFIISIRNNGSPATVRLAASACSAFFSTWLERRYDFIRNPFAGTRERPVRKSVKPLEIPSKQEIETVINLCESKVLRSAFIILTEMGFRVGALPELSIRDGKYRSISKGKEISGTISENCMTALRLANLNLSSPFSNYTAQAMKEALQFRINKIFKHRQIRTRFSPHDIRHRYSIDFYERTKDLYRLKLALHHSSVAVTEIYLKTLGI